MIRVSFISFAVVVILVACTHRAQVGSQPQVVSQTEVEHPVRIIENGTPPPAGLRMFLWMPPTNQRPGDILLADSTIFTTLFGGDEGLERFWKNVATK